MKRSRLDAMKSDVPGVVWPPAFSARTAALAAMVEGFERSQWFDADEIAAGQLRQLAAIAAHFETHSRWFRERLLAAGLSARDLGAPGGLQKLPLLDRREVQARFGIQPVAALPAGHAPTIKVNTSGSTGEPVIIWKTTLTQVHWLALTLRYYLWHEPDFSVRLALIRANMVRFGELPDWGPPITLFFETGALLGIDIEDDVGRQIDLLRDFGAQSLIVYPSNLAAMIGELARRGETLPALSRVRTLGETVSPDLRERAAAELGVALSDCYSTEEAGYMAIECPESRLYHVMSETVIVEVLDDDGQPCAPGVIGRVAVTDLHNHATPLFRYVVGDYAEAGPPCPCGRGLPTLARILGRERNMIVKPDGTRHWPLTGYKQFREIAPVIQYQFVQRAIDRIEVRLVVERTLTDSEQAALADHIRWKLRHPFTIDFVYFEGRLPLGANGKFEEFLSLL